MNSKIPQAEFDKAKDLLNAAHNILIISHRSPDADSVGANLAMKETLEAMGKKVQSACADPVPSNCVFLKNASGYINDFNSADYDLIVTVD